MASRRIEVEIIGDPRSVEAAFGRSATAAQKFQRSMAPVARGAKIALAGIGALGFASVKLANDFNRTSSQMVGLAGVGSKQVEEWKAAILDLAPVVGQVPNELAKSLYFIASSGVPASKALDTLKISAMGATAGLGETEVVADALTSAMNAYAKENLTAAQAADVLAATVREGKGEAAAIAPVLGNILPIASQLGVGFDDVGAAMASMTRLGFDAATAATNLSGVLNAILKPQKQSEEGFKAVGTSSAELQRSLAERGLLPTLQELRDRFEGNNSAMARAFPNVRALRGVLSLVGKAGDDTAAVFARMTDNTGALSHAFKAAAETDSVKMQKALARIEAAGIRIGTVVAPAVADLADAFARGAGVAGEHAQATRAVAIAVAGLSTAVILANTSLKIYNSTLIRTLELQGALRTGLAAAPWVALAAGIALVVHEGLNRLHDALDDTPELLDAAASSARNYKAALDELNTAGEDLADARSREQHAELNEIRTRREAAAAIEQYGRKSLEAREAILNHRDALRELRRAQDGVSKSTQDQVGAGVRARAEAKKAAASIETLRQKYKGTSEAIDGTIDVNRKLFSQLHDPSVKAFAERVRNIGEQAGGTETRVGRAAIAVADLTLKLGRVPTKTEVDLVTNADHTRDRIEAVRAEVARVPRTTFIDFYLRVHGHAPPNVPEGTGRQHGGPVVAGRAYVVGERHAELFIPTTSGTMLPSVPRMGGGGPRTVVFNFPNYVGDRRELDRAMRGSLERMIRNGAELGLRRL